MTDLVVAATSEDAPAITLHEVLRWARELDPEARVVTTVGHGGAVAFRHPDVGPDRAMHAGFEIRLLMAGRALAVDGAWPEYVDVAVFFRDRLHPDLEVVIYDEAGNHVLVVPVGASRTELAARWLDLAG